MNRVLIISRERSDLSDLIVNNIDNVTLISPDSERFESDDHDALCILGGNENESLLLSPSLRLCVEKMQKAGKPVFSEFVRSIGGAIEDGMMRTTHHRMVYSENTLEGCSLNDGDVLDGHYNDCIDYAFKSKITPPVLSYHNYVCAHSNVAMSEEEKNKGMWALWWLDGNTLVSSFRLCNFRRARLAPRASWENIITSVVSFLAGEKLRLAFKEPVCRYKTEEVSCADDADAAVRRGLDWVINADMLKNGGNGGVFEGFAHHVSAKDGEQLRQNNVRADCTCEIGGAFLFDALLKDNSDSREISDRLFKYVFDWLQVKEGEHQGMLRWSEVAWETCYQDDVARAILPLLLEQHFTGKVRYLDNIRAALDYMVDTTGADGIRAFRTDICKLTAQKRQELKKAGVGRPSAHYNSYYHAALLLAYRACGEKKYLEVAQKGLETLMKLYPDTAREQSETQEYCRLILPLAVLYETTGEREHYEWLCRVTEDLGAHRHSSGGYAEWDTDYKAKCARNNSGECALLANNGDPVADLLYSNNWLPLAFAYAYMVTGEKRFYDLWRGIASFMLSCQIHSEDTLLDGAWTRAFDMERWESHGVPHDVGWAPCCIETGWTVGEILMGLQFMHVAERR